MDKGKSHVHSKNDDSEVDLTLRLALAVPNEEETKHVTMLHNFVGLGGESSNNKILAEPLGLRPLATCEPHGYGALIMSSPYEEVLFPVETGFANPSRKRPSVEDERLCKSCGSKNSPVWRKGPSGPQTLCNACGLKHARHLKKVPIKST